MKKHPVDDLFKRKLEGLGRTPSENAWMKIQEKQSASPARRPVVWGWYAAAGVAAAVMGGYLVWQNQQNASPGTDNRKVVAEVKTAPATSEKVPSFDSVAAPVEKLNAPLEQLAATQYKNDEIASVQKELKKAAPVLENAARPKAAEQIAKAPVDEDEEIQQGPVIALNEKPSAAVHAIQPEPIHNPVTQGIKTLPDEPAVSRGNKPEPEPTRTIVVAVETGAIEAEEKPRNTRFARVFRQLKNARAGEKVDWEEVGFNPKNLVARVDDRLRGKDKRSNERDHPKDKRKL